MEGWIVVGVYIFVAVLGFVNRDKGDKNMGHRSIFVSHLRQLRGDARDL